MKGSRSSIFSLNFFHSLAGLGCGGDVGGDNSWTDPSDSLRDLVFPPAFKLLDGYDFIIQEQGVFTRIRSGAAPVAGGGGARGFLSSSHGNRGDSGGKLDWIYSSDCYGGE
jgi:hypothetical protein